MFNIENLPDVTSHHRAETPLTLQWVGMEAIAIPLLMKTQDGQLQSLNAKADVFVSLQKADAKGIHMSRLHMALNQLAEHECTKSTIGNLLNQLVQSQQGISHAARLRLSFDMLLQKSSLLSEESGYQSYPTVITAEGGEDNPTYTLEITIPYSSTCPCSASLSRQLIHDAIEKEFPSKDLDKQALLQWIKSDKGSVATPHSQRSYAYINLTLGQNPWPDISTLIFQLEEVIGTPVQTAVKRRDEQEFARLNANNLMFCEDSARKIKHSLNQMSFVDDYWFKVEHQESLHAHNAVVIDQKN